MAIRVVKRMNSSSALGRLGRGVGLTVSNNRQNSISANEMWNRVSNVGVADTTWPPTSINDGLDRTRIDAGITHCYGEGARARVVILQVLLEIIDFKAIHWEKPKLFFPKPNISIYFVYFSIYLDIFFTLSAIWPVGSEDVT